MAPVAQADASNLPVEARPPVPTPDASASLQFVHQNKIQHVHVVVLPLNTVVTQAGLELFDVLETL